jgi:hypothetical protein
MTSPRTQHDVEVTADGHTVATAHVSTSPDAHGTVTASFRADSGHIPVGSRADLVDAVLDLPEVQGATQLEATVPLGDAESLDRLRSRTATMNTHAAGCSALIDAELSPPSPA